ncbi:type IV pilus assembly protein PilM [Vibrio aquaticus]|uniref:Type IV pilus assembly protein PilM n=1 Tax=Vibrio aquaticus TaxID=2496559 RepID=A0A3S0MHG9_9VIBR|nr:type IV pilus assembly protein PilM [Vibrio aquaticus]RTZ13887.1 type IV pilus assembly protein PilM [Vibrio aquaticus]
MGKSLVTGIDIGHHSIKAVVLKPYKGTFALVGYQELPIDADIFSDNHMLNYQKIVKKLKELRKSLPRFSHKVSLAVPDNAVISKVLQIDSDLEAQEREFAIFQAFSHQSPFPVEELNLDFVQLEKTGSTQTSSYQVYATKKEVVESRVDAVAKAGYKPVLMDVQAHALTQMWQLASRAHQQSKWLMLDVGLTQSSLCIDFFDKAPFCKDIPLGTQSIENLNGIDDLVHSNTERFTRALIEKIQRNVQLLASLHSTNVEGIWLCGGGAMTPMLAEEITRHLHIPCELFNPLSLFDGKKIRSQAELSNGYAYATAVGLALRGIDWLEHRHAA